MESSSGSYPLAQMTFMPEPLPEGAVAPTGNDAWIGGDEVDQSKMFFTGARLTGQARPRI
jgi:hypothetical protein